MRCTIDWGGYFCVAPPLVNTVHRDSVPATFNNMLSSGQLLGVLVIVTTACGLQLPAQTPRTRTTPTSVPHRTAPSTPPPTPPTTRDLQMFRDGKMDETESSTPKPRSEGAARSREVATTTKPQHPAANPIGENTALYKFLGNNNAPCILFKVDAVLTVKYITTRNEEDERSVFIPDNIQIDGDCGSGDDAQMTLMWAEFKLQIYFTKTPGGDRWFVDKIDLDLNTDNPHYEHISNPGALHLFTSEKNGFFYTPVGKSYSCKDETTVLLTSASGKGKVWAELLLRDLRLQPFIFRKDGFGPEHMCSPGGVPYRDETAPIAVGSTLALVVLCTVTGYAVFRYFKIKKVQYDTME